MRLFPFRLKADAGVIVLWGDQPAGVRRMDNSDAGQPQEDESLKRLTMFYSVNSEKLSCDDDDFHSRKTQFLRCIRGGGA